MFWALSAERSAAWETDAVLPDSRSPKGVVQPEGGRGAEPAPPQKKNPSRPEAADPALLASNRPLPKRRGAAREGYRLLAERWMPGHAREVDLDQDGKTDVWREFARNGELRSQLISTSYDGVADLAYYYDNDARVVRHDTDLDRDGIYDISVSYTRISGRAKHEVTIYRDVLSHRPMKWVTVARMPEGFYERTVERDTDGDGRPDLSSRVLLGPEAWARGESRPEPPPAPVPAGRVPMARPDSGVLVDTGEPCLPGYGPAGIPEADMNMLLYQLGDRVEVSGCENFEMNGDGGPGRACTGGRTCFSDRSIEDQVVGALQDGVRCLQKRGERGRRLGYQLLAQVFSSSRRPLRVSCNPPGAVVACPGGRGSAAEYCGRASPFDEAGYPTISLASNCGERDGDLPATIFHEALHLAGEPGHQHVHNYSDVEETEIVEPCAQCCLGTFRPGSSAREAYCDLCTSGSTDTVGHHLRVGILAGRTDRDEIAVLELEKALAQEPNNLELRLELLHANVNIVGGLLEDRRRLEDELRYFSLTADRRTAVERSVAALNGRIGKIFYGMLDGVDAVHRMTLPAGNPRRITPSARAVTGVGLLAENAPGGGQQMSATGLMLLAVVRGQLDLNFFGAGYPPGIKDVDARISSAAAGTEVFEAAGPGALERVQMARYRAGVALSTCARMSTATGPTSDPAEGRARRCAQFATQAATDMRGAAADLRTVIPLVDASPSEARPVTVTATTVDRMETVAGYLEGGVGCLTARPPVAIPGCAAARPAAPAAAVPAVPVASGPACPPPPFLLTD